jgi:hypothetical protein
LDSVERSFFSLLDSMLAIEEREQTSALVTKQRTADFAARRRELDATLQALIDRAEGKITKSEVAAKVDVQTGTATVNSLGTLFSEILTQTYPIVQNGQRLLQESRKLDETVDALLQAEVQSLSALEGTLRNTFKAIDSVTRRLAGRMRDAQGSADMMSIRQGVVALEAAAIGPAGLLTSQSDVLAEKSEITAGREALNRTERLYLDALEDVVEVVRTVNRGAPDDATEVIAALVWSSSAACCSRCWEEWRSA